MLRYYLVVVDNSDIEKIKQTDNLQPETLPIPAFTCIERHTKFEKNKVKVKVLWFGHGVKAH